MKQPRFEERRPIVAVGKAPLPLRRPSSDLRYANTEVDDATYSGHPLKRGKMIPTLVALFLSVLVNFIVLSAAIEYDHENARPPPPPPPMRSSSPSSSS